MGDTRSLDKGSYLYIYMHIWGFPKLGVPFLGVPIIRTIVFWGLYSGPPILGNYHIYIYTNLCTSSNTEIPLSPCGFGSIAC